MFERRVDHRTELPQRPTYGTHQVSRWCKSRISKSSRIRMNKHDAQYHRFLWKPPGSEKMKEETIALRSSQFMQQEEPPTTLGMAEQPPSRQSKKTCIWMIT